MKKAELVRNFNKKVKEVFQENNFKAWLDMQTKFHRYSYKNTILILQQKPNATLVKGFKQWKKDFGRSVKKGEKAIKIFAPVIKKVKKEEEDEQGNIVEVERKELVGFKVVNVFDVKQTKGKSLPEVAKPLSGSSDTAQDIIEAMQDICNKKGAEITYFEPEEEEAEGYYNPRDHKIGIKKRDINQMARVLVHETTHMLTYKAEEEKREDITYQEGEIIAEGTAYIVLNHLGLDQATSFEYIAVWVRKLEEEERLEKFKKVMNSIQSISKKMIDYIKAKQQKREQEAS